MKYSSRFFLYAPVAAFALLFAGVCVNWLVSSRALSQKLDALNGHEIMPGVTLSYSQKEMAGFPFRLDAVFKNLEITVVTANGPAGWRSENFAFHTLSYGKPQQVFEAAGKQTINWTDDKGTAKSLEFVPGSLRASAIEDAGGLVRFDLDLADLGAAALQAGRVQFHIRKENDALQFVLSADVAHLTPKLESAFGDTVKSLKLDGRVAQAVAFDDLRAGKGDWRAALDVWRGKNGAVQFAQSEIAWDKINIGGSGTMLLDQAKRPKGVLHLKIAGLPALTEAAARRGILGGANKGLVAGLLETIGQNDGGKDGVAVTLAFKDGIAYAEQTPVTLLKPLY